MPEFFIVDGWIPVALGVRRSEVPPLLLPSSWEAMGYCMAWDSDPPRLFDHRTASLLGHRVEASEFWGNVKATRNAHSAWQAYLADNLTSVEHW